MYVLEECSKEEEAMKRKNCWEIKKCGREPGGIEFHFSEQCPAAVSGEYDGVNNGIHAGRFCWAVAGTLCGCGGERDGEYASKLMTCLNCDFLKQVNDEEGRFFTLSPSKVTRINNEKKT